MDKLTFVLLLCLPLFPLAQEPCNPQAKVDLTNRPIYIAVNTFPYFEDAITKRIGNFNYLVKVVYSDEKNKDLVWLENVSVNDTILSGLVYNVTKCAKIGIGDQLTIGKSSLVDWMISGEERGEPILYGWYTDGYQNRTSNEMIDSLLSLTEYGYYDFLREKRVNELIDQGIVFETDTTCDVCLVPQNMPEFPGGDIELFRYLGQNIEYPYEAKSVNAQGTVYVSFVINSYGDVSKAKVLKGFHADCDAEALRLVQEMPKWIPGVNNGKTVPVSYNLPIKFTLKGFNY